MTITGSNTYIQAQEHKRVSINATGCGFLENSAKTDLNTRFPELTLCAGYSVKL